MRWRLPTYFSPFNLVSLESFIVTEGLFSGETAPWQAFNLVSLESFIVTGFTHFVDAYIDANFQSSFPRILHCNGFLHTHQDRSPVPLSI